MKPIRALIVDDHALVAEGLERILQLDGRVVVVGSVRTLHEATVFLQRITPDVILLDLRLPDSQGVETVASIKPMCSTARIVVLTGYDWDNEPMVRQLGVEAILKKEMASDLIAQTICDLFRDGSADSRPKERLTPRELDVVQRVAEGMSNPQIARSLHVSLDTVKTHLSHIMQKLGFRRRVDLAMWWRQRPPL